MIAKSTIKHYQSGWTFWNQYIRSVSQSSADHDPFLLQAKDDRERACRFGISLKDRYEINGLRDRAATGIVAHILYHFSIALHPTEFFDTQIVNGVRRVCRSTTEELK